MRRLLLAASAAAVCVTGPLHAAEFVVRPDAGSRVEFVSKAPMETFSGKTRKLSGSIALDPNALGDSIVVQVETDMASFDTGIGQRNQHMRERHLNVDKYPKSTFRGGRLTGLSATSLAGGATVTGKLAGEMDLHGVQKKIEVPFEMSMQGDALHIVTHFEIHLSDYSIARPQFLVMRLDETQKVTVELLAAPR